jgi:sugar lactone lactonase YvrE
VTEWEVAFRDDAELLERPVWDDRTETVIWVDCNAGFVHRLDMGASHTAVDVGRRVGAAALRDNGGIVVARDDGLLFLGADGEPDRDEVPFSLASNVRFNDGACDPSGRFVVGTCSTDGSRGQGALYSVAPDGSVTELLSGITESNGLAWSLDGLTMYYIDTGEPKIRRYSYDPSTGMLGDMGVLITFSEGQGIADGLIVDAEDTLWAAMWEGFSVCRISYDGRVLQRLATPVSRPTCPAFGGPGLDRLYLTTAWEGMDAAARAAEPLAGSLLVTVPGSTGLPAFRFAG